MLETYSRPCSSTGGEGNDSRFRRYFWASSICKPLELISRVCASDATYNCILIHQNQQSSDMSEPPVADLITVEQAIQILDSTPVSPRKTIVPLNQATGLRLAQGILS